MCNSDANLKLYLIKDGLHHGRDATPYTCTLMGYQLRSLIGLGGGGGTQGQRGRLRSLSKFKNIPKALISGQNSTLVLIKTLTFSS